jgi:PTS system ascorbate-specific IIA component
MADLLIIAHAPLASALHAVAQHVLPDLAGAIRTLDVGPHDRLEEVERQARTLLADDQGAPRETLVLTDIPGSTPANVAWRLGDGSKVRVVSGVNPTMIMRALTYRHLSLEEQSLRAHEGGINGVTLLSSTRQQHQQPKPPHDQDPGHHQQ